LNAKKLTILRMRLFINIGFRFVRLNYKTNNGAQNFMKPKN